MSESIVWRARRDYIARCDADKAKDDAREAAAHSATEARARTIGVKIFGEEPESMRWASNGRLLVYYDGDTVALLYAPHVSGSQQNSYQWEDEGFYIIESACLECGALAIRGYRFSTWEEFGRQHVDGIVKEHHAEDCLARPGLLDPKPAPRPPSLDERFVNILSEWVGAQVSDHISDHVSDHHREQG